MYSTYKYTFMYIGVYKHTHTHTHTKTQMYIYIYIYIYIYTSQGRRQSKDAMTLRKFKQMFFLLLNYKKKHQEPAHPGA